MKESNFDKALEKAQERQSDEQVAFRRAVTAGKLGHSLDLREQEMLETFPIEQRKGVLAFVRWSQGRKFNGGPMVKMAAKAAFVQAWAICEAVYGVGAAKSGATDKHSETDPATGKEP